MFCVLYLHTVDHLEELGCIFANRTWSSTQVFEIFETWVAHNYKAGNSFASRASVCPLMRSLSFRVKNMWFYIDTTRLPLDHRTELLLMECIVREEFVWIQGSLQLLWTSLKILQRRLSRWILDLEFETRIPGGVVVVFFWFWVIMIVVIAIIAVLLLPEWGKRVCGVVGIVVDR